ncbi:MAG TPA: hypothetical protein VLA04_06025, partial [Verrucomicrobiae bacterium]|nr:hypothetical protein [Verrucomicrobiae bacterium]
NISSTPWGVAGINIQAAAATYTDSSPAASPVASIVANSLGIPTFAAASATTYTTAANLYIAGAPAAGTNATLTNSYALHVASGASLFQGALTVSAGGVNITGNSTITGTLGGLTGLTVASGGASVSGGLNNNTGGITNSGNIAAGANNTYDIGASGVRYNNGYFNNLNVNNLTVNTSSVSTGALTITSTTTPQLTVQYDVSNYYTTSVSSAGAITLDATGASAGFTFSDAVVASTGLTVTTGGATISAGGITVTGNSTITGTLGGLTGLTVASGGATITGNSTITGTLGGLTGLTVASGGASISGGLNNNAGSITGVGANITGSAGVTLQATAGTLAFTATGSNIITASTNGSERLRIDASGNVGVGISSSLSSARLNSQAQTYTTATGTTSASATNIITGSGTAFTSEVAIGDRIALSSATSTYSTVIDVQSDTVLVVGSVLGNGASQTIRIQKAAFKTYDSSGAPLVTLQGNNGIYVHEGSQISFMSSASGEKVLLDAKGGQTATFSGSRISSTGSQNQGFVVDLDYN